jgi:sensor histidine kinase YesM
MSQKKTKKIIRGVLRDFLILMLIGNVLALFFVQKEWWSVQVVLRNCMFSVGIGYPAMKGMIFITNTLEKKLPWLKSPVKRLIYQVLSLTLFSGLIMFIGFYTWISLTEGLSFKSAIEEIIPPLKVTYIFMFLSLLIGSTILFFKNWREATIQQEMLKRAHLALQYQSLKDQVRPHFLFNSLSSLVTLINTDAEKATLFVHKLSDVYRYVLEQRENELVPLKEELKFLEDYIYLQKIRFGENLQVENQLDLDLKHMVIPLSLQMLVENAIKHNEVSADHPLHIEILSTGHNHIIIKNSLKKKEVSEDSLGMGLNNLKTRLAFFSDEPMQVIEEEDAFIVKIPSIPFQQDKHENTNH